MKWITEIIRDESGQTMTEYALLVALIAVALIVVYQYYGSAIQNRFIGSGNTLYGATNNCGH